MRVKIIILILSITLNALAQKEDIKYAAFNVVSGGITSSAIACFNKPKGQKLGKTFIQSFWKGCLGGSLNYTGKKLIQISSINNTYAYVWPGRIVNSLGSSIIYNGAKNQKLLQSFGMNVFFTRLSYDGKLHCQVDLFTLGSAIVFSFNKNMSFNFKNTMITGSMFFNIKESDKIYDDTDPFQGIVKMGHNYANSIFIKKTKKYIYTYSPNGFTKEIKTFDKEIACHEVIHTFQDAQFFTFNLVTIDKVCKLVKTKINGLIYINPHFSILYAIENRIKGYKYNFFENEADFFSNFK